MLEHTTLEKVTSFTQAMVFRCLWLSCWVPTFYSRGKAVKEQNLWQNDSVPENQGLFFELVSFSCWTKLGLRCSPADLLGSGPRAHLGGRRQGMGQPVLRAARWGWEPRALWTLAPGLKTRYPKISGMVWYRQLGALNVEARSNCPLAFW